MKGAKKTVLILEDIADYSRALKKRLGTEGCQVVVKSTQSSARKFFESNTPDLIYCDGEAPDGSFIHAVPGNLWARVVGISGSRGYNETMRTRGAAALVPKLGANYDFWAEKAAQKGRNLLGVGTAAPSPLRASTSPRNTIPGSAAV